MLFGLFKSKKKKAAMREGERHDEFYTASEVQDDDNEVDSDCDDQEYYRRVAEEVSRRKSTISGSNPVSKNSPVQPGSTHGSTHESSSHGPPFSSSNHGEPSPVSAPAPTPAPKLSLSQPGSVKNPPSSTSTPKTPVISPSPQTVTPISPPPPPAPVSTPASRAAASRPNAATVGPTAMTLPFVVSADRPFSATSVPGAALPAYIPVATPTSKYGRPNASLVPDEKALKTLVMMGFSRPSATLALQRTNNNSELASEFLLEHSAAELNTMLGGTSLNSA